MGDAQIETGQFRITRLNFLRALFYLGLKELTVPFKCLLNGALCREVDEIAQDRRVIGFGIPHDGEPDFPPLTIRPLHHFLVCGGAPALKNLLHKVVI